jgi:hypothetical protein
LPWWEECSENGRWEFISGQLHSTLTGIQWTTYSALGISAKAAAGAAAGEFIPQWLELGAAIVLALLIARALWTKIIGARLVSQAIERFGARENATRAACCGDGRPGET